jgi:hypothetical protein
MTSGMTNMIHKFEAAGLGKAPFRFVGCESKTYQACPGAPLQPGGSCDYCGTAITIHCHVVSADGRRFKVGSDCIAKVGDAGLKRAVDAKKKEARKAREAARIAEGAGMLYDPELRERLEREPHPNGFKGKTLLDWANWMLDHAGNRGKLAVARTIEAYASGEWHTEPKADAQEQWEAEAESFFAAREEERAHGRD